MSFFRNNPRIVYSTFLIHFVPNGFWIKTCATSKVVILPSIFFVSSISFFVFFFVSFDDVSYEFYLKDILYIDDAAVFYDCKDIL